MGFLFWVIFLVLGLLIGKIRGGSFSALAQVQIKGTWALVAFALFDLYGIANVGVWFPAAQFLVPYLSVLVYVPLAALVILNRHVIRPWLVWVAGLLMNTVVILVNGGRIPSLRRNIFGPDALRVPYDANTVLGFLGDWIPMPDNRFVSPGDVLIGIGLAFALQAAMNHRGHQAGEGPVTAAVPS